MATRPPRPHTQPVEFFIGKLKMRYGLQLMGQIRWSEDDSQSVGSSTKITVQIVKVFKQLKN